MSSSKLKKATRYVIDRAKQRKKTVKKVKDSQARSDAEKDPGQFFVINRENEAAKILKVTGIRLGREERNNLFNLCVRYLEMAEGRLRMDPDEKAFLFSKKLLTIILFSKVLPILHKTYLIVFYICYFQRLFLLSNLKNRLRQNIIKGLISLPFYEFM